LAARLEGSIYIEDEDFAGYSLTGEEIAELRAWAQQWADDIRRRLYTETPLSSKTTTIPNRPAQDIRQ
jgi:hypothetical protein